MNHLAVLLLSLLAFGALALATDRHQKIVLERRLAPTITQAVWIAGWGALILALFAAVRGSGWALGLVAFSGYTSLSAGIVLGGLIAYERTTTSR